MNNKDFANEVLNIVHSLDSRLSIKLNYNLCSIDKPDMCDLIDEDEEDDEKEVKKNENKWGLSDQFKLAYQVLGETTSRGYDRIRKHIAATLNDKLPSVYYLNKALPLKAVPCLFDVEVNENEKEKERNDLVYGKK